jgi:hypothetical protein
MNNLDYKAEVKAINKDASMSWNQSTDVFNVWIKEQPFLIGSGTDVDLAWQNAYENLKKEGRIL